MEPILFKPADRNLNDYIRWIDSLSNCIKYSIKITIISRYFQLYVSKKIPDSDAISYEYDKAINMKLVDIINNYVNNDIISVDCVIDILDEYLYE